MVYTACDKNTIKKVLPLHSESQRTFIQVICDNKLESFNWQGDQICVGKEIHKSLFQKIKKNLQVKQLYIKHLSYKYSCLV